jgi:hypothetical protein
MQVEYDFVPNRVVVPPNTYLHFQWTGSDYNPRRGCNDGNGGPPDPNDFISSANADQNSRADRSNAVLVDALADTIPMDVVGVPQGLVAAQAQAAFADTELRAMNAMLSNAPCYSCEPSIGSGCWHSSFSSSLAGHVYADTSSLSTKPPATDQAALCYDQLMKLAFLNQDQDEGSLQLRRSRKCLTEQGGWVGLIWRHVSRALSTMVLTVMLPCVAVRAERHQQPGRAAQPPSELRQHQRQALPILRWRLDEGQSGLDVTNSTPALLTVQSIGACSCCARESTPLAARATTTSRTATRNC